MKLPFVLRSTYTTILAKLVETEAKLAYADYIRDNQQTELKQAAISITNLSGCIRNIDQLIFQMSQCTSWDQMRPIFNQLQRDCESRQRAESTIISSTVIAELERQKADLLARQALEDGAV